MPSRILLLSLILSIASPQALADMRESSEENINCAGDRLYQESPKAHYTIECSVNPNKGILDGTENIYLKNTTNAPLRELQIKWTSYGYMGISCRGKTVRILSETREGSGTCVTVVELPEPIHMGGDAKLKIEFEMSSIEYAGAEKLPLTGLETRHILADGCTGHSLSGHYTRCVRCLLGAVLSTSWILKIVAVDLGRPESSPSTAPAGRCGGL